jgi:hypothetical protein
MRGVRMADDVPYLETAAFMRALRMAFDIYTLSDHRSRELSDGS